MGIDTHYTNSMLQRIPKSSEQLVREQGGGSTGRYAYDGSYNPLAVQAATKAQSPGNELTGLGMQLGQHDLLRALVERLESQYKGILGKGGPPKPAGFGFNLPTMEMGGNVLGGIGKFMTGLGALETSKYAGKSFDEKSKYNALNWEQQLLKRAGEVSGENALRGDDNAYRTAQGIGHLAKMIPA